MLVGHKPVIGASTLNVSVTTKEENIMEVFSLKFENHKHLRDIVKVTCKAEKSLFKY